MIKNILSTSCFLFTFSAVAQITITAADMPDANDSLYISTTTSLGTHDPSETGAGHNWDFSDLVPAYQQGVKFIAPGKFPSVYNFLFNALNTSYGKNNPLISSLDIQGIKVDASIDFFKESNASLNQIGVGYVVNNIPLPFSYKHPDVIYKFPLNYLNTDSCDFDFGLAIPGYGYYGQTGHRLNLVDGWGELKTPYTTYSNTIRVKSVINVTDTIYNDADSVGAVIVRPPHYEYKWFAQGSKIPVLQIDGMLVSSQLVYSIAYIDTARKNVIHLGIDEDNRTSNIQLFPNPARDQFTISFDNGDRRVIRIWMVDVLGKGVQRVTNESLSPGKYQYHVDTSTLPTGVYFVNMLTGSDMHVEKINVLH